MTGRGKEGRRKGKKRGRERGSGRQGHEFRMGMQKTPTHIN